MKIALAQMNVVAARPRENAQNMMKIILDCRAKGVKTVFFPELCLSGYLIGDLWERESFLKECEYWGHQIRLMSQGLNVVFGNVGVAWGAVGEDGRVRKFNSFFCAIDGAYFEHPITKQNHWNKVLLPNYRQFEETRHFYDVRRLASELNIPLHQLLLPITLKDEQEEIQFGIGICEDAWHVNYGISPFEMLEEKKVDCFVNLSSSPYYVEKSVLRQSVIGSLAKKLNKPFLYLNAVGVQNNGKTIYGFDGQSMVFHKGLQHVGAFFTAETLTLDVVVNKGHESILKVDANTSMHLKKESRFSSWAAECVAGLEAMVSNCVAQWNIKHVVVGVSGGIDSALAAVLYTRILGSNSVTLVNMPSHYNSQLTRKAAQDLASNLGCSYLVIPIEDVVQKTLQQLKEADLTLTDSMFPLHPLVGENIQARDRGGRILAAVASARGGVFACNGNKTELTVGYATLYGDLAGFLAPFADVWKCEIYEMARYYNEVIFKRFVIPKETLEVVPSAELSNSQDVSKGLGDPFVYEYHDRLFASWVEERLSPLENLQSYLSGTLAVDLGLKNLPNHLAVTLKAFVEDLERWWTLYQGMAAFKRLQSPPIISLSRRTFGYDHRECVGPVWWSEKYLELKNEVLGR